MMKTEEIIIIFTRFPVPGKTKTRLIPSIGKNAASNLQKEMTKFIVKEVRSLEKSIEIRYTGSKEHHMQEWLGDDLAYTDQGEGDLGARMNRAFQDHFQNGAKRVVIVGCDCPSNRRENIRTCFEFLKKNHCVLGPAKDGGYYMIGLNQYIPEIFQGISWGSDCVFEETISKLKNPPKLLKTLNDVDLVEDIPKKISVIIPVLNEEKMIDKTLQRVSSGFNIECILVDGGSHDQTLNLAAKYPVKILSSEKGRAKQMNVGALRASGDFLLFLHADTELPILWDDIIRRHLNDQRISLGAFRFKVRQRLNGIALIEWGTNLRSWFLNLPYGDQALFVRKKDFDESNGYPQIPIMEDFELVRKFQKKGKIKITKESVVTSGRRWKQKGVFQTFLINQRILIGTIIGKPYKDLKKLYD